MNKINRKILAVILAALQAVMLLSGCSLFPTEKEPEPPELKTPAPITYSFYKVKEDTLVSSAAGVGTITSVYYTTHSFPVSGSRLKALYVTLGQYVNEGDLLMELDNTDLELEYLQAELTYERQRLSYEEQERLYRNGSISETAYKVAQLELENAQKQYEAIKAAYDGTKIYAKVSGKIVYIDNSYTAPSGDAPLIEAGKNMISIDSEDPEYTYVVFDKSGAADEFTPKQFRIGAKLTLTLLDDSGTPVAGVDPFEGTVVSRDSIGYVSNSSADKYYCKMENPPAEAALGAVVRYDFTEYAIENCIIIPSAAIHEFNGSQFVYMLDSNTNLRKEIPVQIGYRTSSQAQVLDGLKVGDIIING